MAGQRIMIGGTVMFIDYADGQGSATVNGRKWRWEFHEYTGPAFLRADGNARRYIPGEKHPVWQAFGKWLKRWRKKHPVKKGKGAPIKLNLK